MRQAVDDLNAYLSEEIERHRREELDDLIGVMLTMSDMSEGEMRSTAKLLLLSGYDTTAKLMSETLVVLEAHPDQRRLVAEDPALIPGAIEEVLRWRGISQMTVPRVVKRDTVFAGTHMAAGDVVYVLLSAANRDPARWSDPLRFDVRRTPKGHLGFGFGPHLCLGAPLARLETKVALERLLRIAPQYGLHGIDYGKTYFVRGPERGFLDVSAAPGAVVDQP
jgi:cytochrome P450